MVICVWYLSLLYTYGVSSNGFFTDEGKRRLSLWIEQEKQGGGGSLGVAERWSFSVSELDSLTQRLG